MDTEQQGRPIELVFAGRRALTGGKVGHVFYELLPTGKLGTDKMIYADIKTVRTVGGIYEGARYNDATKVMYGLQSVRWRGTYDDEVTVAGWEALDHELSKDKAAARAEAKYRSALQERLLPIRRVIRSLQKRGQHHEASAYRDMVFAELFKPLTKAEIGEDE